MKAPPGRNLAERRALREAEAKIRRGLDPARSRTFAAINTALPILGALAVVAIMVDLLTIQKNAGEGFKIPKELQSVMLESTGEPYVDAGGLFSIVDICFIFRDDRRCIHDLIAGTQVVKD